MAQNCLCVGTTVLSTSSPAVFSLTGLAGPIYSGGIGGSYYYIAWYKRGNYWKQGATGSSSRTSDYSSTYNVYAGDHVAASLGGGENLLVESKQCFTISVQGGTGGTVAGGGLVASGGSIAISATPTNGGTSAPSYVFSQWQDGSGSASRTLTNVSADATYTASFAQSTWKISAATESSTKGTVSSAINQYRAPGTTVSCTATAKAGYTFIGWFRAGQSTPDYTTATASLLVYSTDTVYTAKFYDSNNTLTVTAGTGGSVAIRKADGTPVTSGTNIDEGTSITVTATPKYNYVFSQWSVSGIAGSSSASYTFTMPANAVTLTAIFTPRDAAVLTLDVENQEMGTVSLKRSGSTDELLGGTPDITNIARASAGGSVSINGGTSGNSLIDGNRDGAAWSGTGQGHEAVFSFADGALHTLNSFYISYGSGRTETFTYKIYWSVSASGDDWLLLHTSSTVETNYSGTSFGVPAGMPPCRRVKIVVNAEASSAYSIDEVEINGYRDAVILYQGIDYTLKATVLNTTLNMFVGWYSGETLLSNQLSYTFTPVSSGISITAKFAQQTSYAVELRPTDGTIPYNAVTDPAAVAECALSIRDPEFESPDKWLSGNLTVTATPAESWRVMSWRVQNASTGAVISTITTTSLTHTFALSVDSIIYCVFEKIPVRITVAVDAPSDDAGAGTVAIFGTDESYTDVKWGDQVKLEAESGEGFTSGGWYRDGVLVEENYQHIFYATEDMDFVAKFKATVTLTVSKGGVADGSPEVQIDDGSADGVETSADVIIGETCVIKAIGVEPEGEAKGSIFDSWYQTADAGFLYPIAGYDEEATIAVLGNVALTARFVGIDDLENRYLAIRNYDNNAQAYDPLIGAVWATGGTEIYASEWNAFFYKPSPDPLNTEGSGLAPGDRYFKFTGTKGSVLSALPAASVGFMQWTGRYLIPVEGEVMEGDPKFTLSDPFVIGTSSEAQIATNRHYVIDAVWGDPVPVKVRLRYGAGSDSTMGSFDMQPESARETIQSGIEDMYMQGSVATISASSANGYAFAGWFLDAACTALLSANPWYALTVSVAVDVYAKFEQDTDAIYKWEGGAENKMLRWRSKRYVSAKPFNPSAARVYADAYPVTLNIYAASSPDAPVTASTQSQVLNQNGKRLPMARPEKYFEIEVTSMEDVTEVAVGTSMGGLAQ